MPVVINGTTGVTTPGLDASGTNKFATTIGVGGATPSGSGAGITFPATQSTSTNANTLDDYEEGTFSPLYLGSTTDPTVTYTNQSGFYTKIGNVVYITANMQWSTFSGGSGILFIGNLPFAASSSSFQGGGVISYAFGMPTKGMFYMDAGTSRFVTQRVDSPTGYINIPDVGSSGHIMFGMFYRV